MAKHVDRHGRHAFPAGYLSGGRASHAIRNGRKQAVGTMLGRFPGSIDLGFLTVNPADEVGILVVLPNPTRVGDGSVIYEHEPSEEASWREQDRSGTRGGPGLGGQRAKGHHNARLGGTP